MLDISAVMLLESNQGISLSCGLLGAVEQRSNLFAPKS